MNSEMDEFGCWVMGSQIRVGAETGEFENGSVWKVWQDLQVNSTIMYGCLSLNVH